MKPVECEFESEALSAALECRWPDRVDAPLRAHVATCEICSGVVAIASAIEDAREEMRSAAVVPDSGRVWWLAQLRARREAAAAAGRPITAVQVIAFACAAGLLGAWFADIKAFLPSAISLLAAHGALVLAMAAVLFVVPTAVYLALGRD